MIRNKKVSKKILVESFAEASRSKDFETLKMLLDEGGEYEIQPETKISDIVDRSSFIEWYKGKLEAISITDIEYDQCVHCELGKPVVLFNKGKFPKNLRESHERSKAGLMLKIKNSKIIEIKFCYIFLKTENKYVFECQGEEMKKLIKGGMTPDQAIERVTGLKH